MEDTQELGATLRKQRTEKGLTQIAFAKISGIPLRTLIRMEAGDAAVAVGTYTLAARALGVKLSVIAASVRRRPTLDEVYDRYREPEDDNRTPSRPRGG